jgi:cytochrome b pre-mRNA-processing protein 3
MGFRPEPRANPMILRRFAPNSQSGSIAALYGAIVAQARAPAFYRSYGVPDTVSGRLEMLMLHIVLVLRHLEDGTAENRQLGQALFDHFCNDMDAHLREMGIGDLAVPGKMRRVGEAFYGRQVAYRVALAASDPNELVLALRRNVFAGALNPDNTGHLAMYSRQLVHELTGQGGFEQGEIRFPDPESLPMQMVAQHE